MLAALVGLPLFFALVAYAIPSNRLRPWILPVGGLAHVGLMVRAQLGTIPAEFDGWLGLDAPGRLVLGVISVLFLSCSIYAPGYLRVRSERPNRLFCAGMLGFLGMMTLIILSQRFGL